MSDMISLALLWPYLGTTTILSTSDLHLEARPPAFAAPRPPGTADECRRAGNDLYRAASVVAMSYGNHDGLGVTFGTEGWAK